ncbi:hypothetical protein BV25DRAFT_269390 [Artomyces pyxidatus]|uniref:Uncharacterized protein n=1 Tax=Artomyces pyxidatus TaxID=48021 RepID=A0ACB8T768_9AGAM|nr:hypothetical protein BV25DRAFT_269390 [Artomyces pyxidatus]
MGIGLLTPTTRLPRLSYLCTFLPLCLRKLIRRVIEPWHTCQMRMVTTIHHSMGTAALDPRSSRRMPSPATNVYHDCSRKDGRVPIDCLQRAAVNPTNISNSAHRLLPKGVAAQLSDTLAKGGRVLAHRLFPPETVPCLSNAPNRSYRVPMAYSPKVPYYSLKKE